MQNIKRIIPLEEVKETEYYEDMADLAVIFNHDIIEDSSGVWRWKANKLVCRIQGDDGGASFYTPAEWKGSLYNQSHLGAVDISGLSLMALNGEILLEEFMKFNMQIGYSLCGYGEVFGQREVTEYGLAFLSTPPSDFNYEEEYYQTPIEYMLIKHAGKVLKL